MNELERILKKAPSERTQEEKDYLSAHASEMSEEQTKQLETESKGESKLKELIGKKVFSQFAIEEIKEIEGKQLRAIISSESMDRHGEILSMKGLDIKTYMSNPVIAPFHKYDEPSVGRTNKLTKTKDGKLIAEFEFATDIEDYKLPRILDALYRKGYQFAFSIGFIAYEVEGDTFTKSEMIEFSPVLIGANAEALLMEAKSKGFDLTKIIPADKKEIDNTKELNYRKSHMNLKDILSKAVADLTFAEIKFLQQNSYLLSQEQKSQFAEVLESVSAKEDPAVAEAVAKALAPLQKEITDLKNADSVEVKSINIAGMPVNAKEISKENLFLLYYKGVRTNDFSDYLAVQKERGVQTKSAMNTTEDSAVVPPTEFIAEVNRLEEEVGVARRFARIKRTTRTSVTLIMGDDDLEIFDTAEAGVKQSTKMSFTNQVITLRKFAGILPITDELGEDSAVDLWNEATRRFARAFVRKEDQMVFTETAGSGKFPGILNVSGTKVITLPGDSIEDLDYDTVSKMIFGVPTPSSRNGKFFLKHDVVGVVQRIKDDEGRPIWQRAMADGTPATILGKPYVETDVLPGLDADAEELPFMAFGDLDYVTLVERTMLKLEMFNTGIVQDPDDAEEDLNLLTQDMQVMRAVKRMNARVRFPAAFSVAVTASSAS